MTASDWLEAVPLLVAAMIVLLLRRGLRPVADWGPMRPAASLRPDANGDLVVPVSKLMWRRTFGGSHNSLSPKLWITPVGLRVKVFKLSERSFEDFERVDARKSLLQGVRLIFFAPGEQLHVVLADRAVARAVLQCLPPELPLGPSAAALRDAP